MYISDTDTIAKMAKRTALIYACVSALCAVFGVVYECFGNGVYTFFMLGAFVFPLVLGFLPFFLCALFPPSVYPDALARTVWHSAVATFTLGSIYKGVLVIYGTDNKWSLVYWIAAGVLAVAAIALLGAIVWRAKRK